MNSNQNAVLLHGEVVTELPKDLFIPQNFLTVKVDPFLGPLDLLLYLIRRQNLDITEISVASVCEQYMAYIQVMKGDLELIAQYLVIAATLAEIKSRVLLPKPLMLDSEEPDPSSFLIQQLVEYERLKIAAEGLDGLPRMDRDLFPVSLEHPSSFQTVWVEKIHLKPEQLIHSFSELMKRTTYASHHFIQREFLSVRERMTKILNLIKRKAKVYFHEFLDAKQGTMGVVVTLLALLELMKMTPLEVEEGRGDLIVFRGDLRNV
ncbi:MAG: segregation/condensation protein A [Gammaproteobacteria bacterium]|nr:segregation/condensation protein A [Gammaproteobacteria bacterium]